MRSAGAAIAAVALTIALSVALFSPAPGVHAQPQLTLIFPEDGDVLEAPPPIIHLCFDSPVNIRDLTEGGDFDFDVIRPIGRTLGARIVFQPDGFGVDIHPGTPPESAVGEWTFEWRVTDPDTLEPTSGSIKYTVDPDGDPLPEEEPERCPGTGVPVDQPPTPAGSPPAPGTPTPSPGATPSPEPTPSAGEGDEDDDDQDILLIALITTGAAAGAAVLGLVGYLVRRRIGFWPHRPPPPGGGPGGLPH